MSVYPRNLSTFLNRLSGYNKNNVKMNVLGASTANTGDTIQVDLPTNSIVDLSSLAWSFKILYSLSGTDNGAGADDTYSPPINCEGLISRLAIEVNGQTLCNLTNYNHLFHALLYVSATEDYQRQRMVAQSNTGTGAGGSAVAFDNTVGNFDEAARTQEHVIDSWVGFLGSAKPNFIDTSLLGNVRITITLAGSEIFSKSNARATPSYAISEQHFSMDVVSISDGIYDAMVDQMLASGAPLEIPFKNYFSFTDSRQTMDHSFNFHVASQSIDRLWAVPRGTRGDEAAGLTATANPVHPIVGNDNQIFRYRTCGGQNFQFQVNNTLYPNWSTPKAQDWWQHTKLAVGDQGNMLSGSYPQSMVHYTGNFFVYACSLEHQTDGDERFVSGIDTRGAAASCMFKSGPGHALGGAAPNDLFIFAECTSSLRIMANKVLEIVQ